jgi:CRISPR-associated endonuclease/helicase Cas3
MLLTAEMDEEFQRAFKALTTHKHFPWQYELYQRFVQGNLPDVCDIPTGLGKTSIIPIWVIALANVIGGRRGDARLPRRLVYIVNRRTVVDQATDEAVGLRDRIRGLTEVTTEDKAILDRLRAQLLAASAMRDCDTPIAISTLRGELADNGDWKADPARPAIIIGTVDMIGSKLLFSGYGDGYKLQPHHAGLIGQDALFVHDEAHLTPALSKLLRQVAEIQRERAEPRGIHVVELSATSRQRENVLGLSTNDEGDPRVFQRLNAPKSLSLEECGAGELADALAKRASAYEDGVARVLMYVQRPEIAAQVAQKLKKRLGESAAGRVAVLTGTIRGHERDALVGNNPVFRAMLPPRASMERTVYLVSTSAGEVGINLDADHMVCDLSTLDSLIQRFGRVNRFGDGTARIHMVVEKERSEQRGPLGEFHQALAATISALCELPQGQDGGYVASPKALRRLEGHTQGWRPQPGAPPLDDILLDGWSLTSIRGDLPNRPPVASWLHGFTSDPPETHVAWRAEVQLLCEGSVLPDELRSWYRNCRIEARERLREPTGRVYRKLAQLRQMRETDIPVVVLDERGNAERTTVGELLKKGEQALGYRTVVLPAETGGLSEEGILDPRADRPDSEMDVAETGPERSRTRLVLRQIGSECWYRPLFGEERGPHQAEIQDFAAELAKERGMVVSQLLPLTVAGDGEEDSGEMRHLLHLVEPRRGGMDLDDSAVGKRPPKLEAHTDGAVVWMRRIAEALELDPAMGEALALAARWHDSGKNRQTWQQAIYNSSNVVLAKPGPRGMNWRLLAGYRHEFGSILDAAQREEVRTHVEHDLILHLIAAHHGRGRPHFDPEGFDVERHTTEVNEEAAQEVMRRFSRLQQRFGHWGLAWLESLLRCADILASQEAGESQE